MDEEIQPIIERIGVIEPRLQRYYSQVFPSPVDLNFLIGIGNKSMLRLDPDIVIIDKTHLTDGTLDLALEEELSHLIHFKNNHPVGNSFINLQYQAIKSVEDRELNHFAEAILRINEIVLLAEFVVKLNTYAHHKACKSHESMLRLLEVSRLEISKQVEGYSPHWAGTYFFYEYINRFKNNISYDSEELSKLVLPLMNYNLGEFKMFVSKVLGIEFVSKVIYDVAQQSQPDIISKYYELLTEK